MHCIESKNLSKTFDKIKAVHDLSFTIEENKITGLVGRTVQINDPLKVNCRYCCQQSKKQNIYMNFCCRLCHRFYR